MNPLSLCLTTTQLKRGAQGVFTLATIGSTIASASNYLQDDPTNGTGWLFATGVFAGGVYIATKLPDREWQLLVDSVDTRVTALKNAVLGAQHSSLDLETLSKSLSVLTVEGEQNQDDISHLIQALQQITTSLQQKHERDGKQIEELQKLAEEYGARIKEFSTFILEVKKLQQQQQVSLENEYEFVVNFDDDQEPSSHKEEIEALNVSLTALVPEFTELAQFIHKLQEENQKTSQNRDDLEEIRGDILREREKNEEVLKQLTVKLHLIKRQIEKLRLEKEKIS